MSLAPTTDIGFRICACGCGREFTPSPGWHQRYFSLECYRKANGLPPPDYKARRHRQSEIAKAKREAAADAPTILPIPHSAPVNLHPVVEDEPEAEAPGRVFAPPTFKRDAELAGVDVMAPEPPAISQRMTAVRPDPIAAAVAVVAEARTPPQPPAAPTTQPTEPDLRRAYFDLLMEKVRDTPEPSPLLLDRIERLLELHA